MQASHFFAQFLRFEQRGLISLYQLQCLKRYGSLPRPRRTENFRLLETRFDHVTGDVVEEEIHTRLHILETICCLELLELSAVREASPVLCLLSSSRLELYQAGKPYRDVATGK